jgi:hypothetical protein
MRVVLLGRIGDGKTVVARYLHDAHGFNQLHLRRGRPLRAGPPRPLDEAKLQDLIDRVRRYAKATPLVVDDVGYPAELEALKREGFKAIRVVPPTGPGPRGRRDPAQGAGLGAGAPRIVYTGDRRNMAAAVTRWLNAERRRAR